jgi:predicted RNA-binding Zn ribbon-like protein
VSIEQLVDFLNTYDPGSDEEELANDTDARDWFAAHGLATTGLRAADARRVRTELRDAAERRTPVTAALAGVPLRAAVEDGALTLASDHPLGPLVATAVRLAFEGRWDRLKLCDADTCRYAFFDGSRNRSGRWCSMAECGNRAKSRAFRERHRSG